ncbi:MAG: glucokinase [Polyangiaceae bacterium]
MIVVGDIGGTRARLSLLSPTGRTVRHQAYESRKYPSLEAVVQAFLAEESAGKGGKASRARPKVTAAAFGIAGPVVNGRCVATNLPWVADEQVLARRREIKRVRLLHDRGALSLGALTVPKSKLRVLGAAGSPKRKGASVAVIAAGTGLGEAILIWDGSRFVPSATEGGHSDFAPNGEVDVGLYAFLRARHGHVSWERVLSGNGLGNLYDYFASAGGVPESADNARAVATAADRNAEIARLAEGRQSEVAARAVELFAKLYGAEAGNLALKSLAVGGVFVCGNIAARMAGSLEANGFIESFAAKGRFEALMRAIPVAVVLDSDIGLAGAASVALAR